MKDKLRFIKKRNIRMLMCILCVCSCTFSAFAQGGKPVSGKVVDDKGEAVIGASVIVKGTSTGTVTDASGSFSLAAAPDAVLVISYLGFKKQEVKAGSSPNLTVVLSEDINALDEVIVVGYGTSKKRDLTGAISSVSSKVYESNLSSSLESALQGRLSGVSITTDSNQPGGGVSIRVRGITSLTGSNEPLYVIDGIPFDGSTGGSLGDNGGAGSVSALSTINPNDIANIDVLKDASATAIYGARGANGVVLITTKTAAAGQSETSYEGSYGLQSLSRKIEMMTLREYADMARTYRPVFSGTPGLYPAELERPEMLGKGTDWQDALYRVAPVQSHQVSISNGTGKTRFYTSLGYYAQDGIMLGSNFRRVSGRINIDHEYSKRFRLGETLNISLVDESFSRNDASDGISSIALRQSPAIPVRVSDGTWAGATPDEGSYIAQGVNPVAYTSIRKTDAIRKKLNGSIWAELNLIGLPGDGLSLRSQFGFDINENKAEAFKPTYTIGLEQNDLSALYKDLTSSWYLNWVNSLNYNKTIKEHSLQVMLATEMSRSEWGTTSLSMLDFVVNEPHDFDLGDVTTSRINSGKTPGASLSYFGRFNYGYKSRYLLTGTFRADGSSNFAKGNKWGYFPSVSAAWVASEESFIKDNLKALSWMKIRTGYGEVGNSGVPAFAYSSLFKNISSDFGIGFLQNNFPNPNLKWETIQTYNLGVELGFIDNKIRLDADFYLKKSKDFLYRASLPDYMGVLSSWDYGGISAPYTNVGSMENRGVDLTLTTRNISNASFSWGTTVIFSTYRNRLLSMNENNFTMYRLLDMGNTATQTKIGQPVGMFYGFKTDGLFKSEEQLYHSPSQGAFADPTNPSKGGIWLGDVKYRDLHEDDVIDDRDKTIIGNPHPDFTYGITNDFTYKGFDLSILIQGTYGNDILNWQRRYLEGYQPNTNFTMEYYRNHYREGVNTDTNVLRFTGADGVGNQNYRVSDRFIEDGSYLRIKTATLGYTFPRQWLAVTKVIKSLRIYATGQNLWTFTKFKGYDPDLGNTQGIPGVELGKFPASRTFIGGLKIVF